MPKIRLTQDLIKDSGRVIPVGTAFEVTVEYAKELVAEKKAVYSKEAPKKISQSKDK